MPVVVDSTDGLSTGESFILDPVEVATGRVELNIHSDPIRVRVEGPDWGDSEIAAYMAELGRGEIPVDFRVPNRKVTFPLMIGRDGYQFEEGRAWLQAKVARFQQEGGWLKREFSDGRKLYLDVVGASLHFGGDTFQAVRYIDNTVNLVLETLPDWYGYERAATITDGMIANIEGDYPGRVRIIATEHDGEDQLGLLWAFRSRHYSDADTARLRYDAIDLEPLDSAAVDVDAIEHADLGANWTPVVGTDYLTDSLTHTGSYRWWVLAESDDGEDVRLRGVWDVGDLTLPVENRPITIPAANNLYLLDLGEIRLDPPPVGTHRWRGQVQAQGAAGGEQVRIKRLLFQPLDESAGRLAAPVNPSQGLADYVARDEFRQTVSGGSDPLTGLTLPVGDTWSGAGDADDFVVEDTDHTVQRTAVSDTGVTGRVDFADTPTLSDVVVQADVMASTLLDPANVPALGVAARYVDINNCAGAYVVPITGAESDHIIVSIWKRIGGANTTVVALRGTGFSMVAGAWYTLRLMISAAGWAYLWLFPRGAAPGEPILRSQDSVFATGGTLEDGKVGLYDTHVTAAAVTRTYDNFASWVPTLDAILFANQSAQLGTDGMVRLDATGAAYGPVSQVIGDLPRIPPSGLEGRSVESFLYTSSGDFDQLPDAEGSVTQQVFYKPSWLIVPGA